ncbi:unnamed protein product [Mytilus edulis]|uniref:Uncharacterized protein n=1 Tax=Mytilus edulis TaxID=6550 RepID=A0A8S3UL26_MYTED|nr:unnamed protein product [Mytilus edulis]
MLDISNGIIISGEDFIAILSYLLNLEYFDASYSVISDDVLINSYKTLAKLTNIIIIILCYTLVTSNGKNYIENKIQNVKVLIDRNTLGSGNTPDTPYNLKSNTVSSLKDQRTEPGKRGRKSLTSMFPNIVPTAKDFIEEHGYQADSRRRCDTARSSGVTLDQIKINLWIRFQV